jgi:hypothetical protein
MKTKIHREKLLFNWITKNHEITVGFKRVEHGRCSKCGKTIPWGNTLCNECFEKDKKVSGK